MPTSSDDPLPIRVILLNTMMFAVAFAAWVLLGPSAREIGLQLGLSPSQIVLCKAIPILAGSALRIPVGVMTDRFGARTTFSLVLALSALGLVATSWAASFAGLVAGGFVFGFVGTTFVVGVQSVSSWTPPTRRGAALGIFGAGNIGTCATVLLVPIVMSTIGWRMMFRVYAAMLLVAAVVYWLSIRNAPGASSGKVSLSGLLAPLTQGQVWRFGLYYMATFGAFVAGTLMFGDIYITAYGVKPATAGVLAMTFTLTASLARIPGGILADRIGARRTLRASLLFIAIALILMVLQPPLPLAVFLLFVAGVAMGVGMAATFRYVPDYYPRKVGAVGGVVGALGGIAGFYLPLFSHLATRTSATSHAQVLPLAGVALLALAVQWVAAARIDALAMLHPQRTTH